MRLAIAQHSGEGCEVNTIGLEVEGVNTRNRTPEIRVNAAGVNPGIDGRDAGRLSINAHFPFAEAGRAAIVKLTRNIVGRAGVPELIVALTLREDVKIDAFYVGRQREGCRELVAGRIQRDRSACGTSRHGQHDVRSRRRLLPMRYGIELNGSAAVQMAGVFVVDDIEEINLASLSNGEQRAVVSQIALHVPGAHDVM